MDPGGDLLFIVYNAAGGHVLFDVVAGDPAAVLYLAGVTGGVDKSLIACINANAGGRVGVARVLKEDDVSGLEVILLKQSKISGANLRTLIESALP